MTSPPPSPEASATLPGLDGLPEPDRHAIGATVGPLLAGFQQRDAALLAGVYADDAGWVNAFGSVKRGADTIVEYLRGVFSPTPTSTRAV